MKEVRASAGHVDGDRLIRDANGFSEVPAADRNIDTDVLL